ncbi:hypothetical protein JTE90_025543 [Oedothorax gibbosus]|uniref:Uncharacterized protein n=1 Tax=Oedothorax gibbosus TaxID=931172 RepID=A0AAV6TVJ5_9ARAC|nr:hypothetical protein JTE90_025543 [Oedothorax gibbosus]
MRKIGTQFILNGHIWPVLVAVFSTSRITGDITIPALLEYKNISIPPVLKRKGRSKGFEANMMGLQACQGDGTDSTVTSDSTAPSRESTFSIPTCADFLVGLATVPGWDFLGCRRGSCGGCRQSSSLNQGAAQPEGRDRASSASLPENHFLSSFSVEDQDSVAAAEAHIAGHRGDQKTAANYIQPLQVFVFCATSWLSAEEADKTRKLHRDAARAAARHIDDNIDAEEQDNIDTAAALEHLNDDVQDGADGIRDTISSSGLERSQLLTNKDLHNIEHSFNVGSEAKGHPNDGTSVEAWVNEINADPNSCVLLYKPQGVTCSLASLRIHVERVIGVLRRKYRMLEGRMPIYLVSHSSNQDENISTVKLRDQILT